ncbi:MAG: redoxin domain-containing protein [Chthoniobacterales bacterium]
MRYITGILFFGLFSLSCVHASPVRVAPDFTWVDASGKTQSTKNFKGKPIVILIAPNAKDWHFRAQVGAVQERYERLSAMGALFIAAFTEESTRIRSNVPFIIASDGPNVGYLYDISKGAGIAIIGKDGNLDYVTNKIIPGQRIMDVINNSEANQEKLRRE